jgi:predicted phosphoribosyltransferase
MSLAGRVVVVVDDGSVTATTLSAAIDSIRLETPWRVVVALPVGTSPVLAELERQSDEVVCLVRAPAGAPVAAAYDELPEVAEAEAIVLLRRSARSRAVTLERLRAA